MEYKDNSELTVMHKFDVFIKTVIKNAAQNYDALKANKYNDYELLDENITDDESQDILVISKKFLIYGKLCEVRDEELAELIDKLPNEMKNVLLLYYFCNLSEQEIADLLHISQMAINKRKHKALDIMRKLMEKRK